MCAAIELTSASRNGEEIGFRCVFGLTSSATASPAMMPSALAKNVAVAGVVGGTLPSIQPNMVKELSCVAWQTQRGGGTGFTWRAMSNRRSLQRLHPRLIAAALAGRRLGAAEVPQAKMSWNGREGSNRLVAGHSQVRVDQYVTRTTCRCATANHCPLCTVQYGCVARGRVRP